MLISEASVHCTHSSLSHQFSRPVISVIHIPPYLKHCTQEEPQLVLYQVSQLNLTQCDKKLLGAAHYTWLVGRLCPMRSQGTDSEVMGRLGAKFVVFLL